MVRHCIRCAAVALVVGLAVVAGAAVNAPAKPRAVTPSPLSGEFRLVSHTQSRTGLDLLIKNFNVQYPNVKVNTQYVPTGAQLGPTLLAMMNSNPPDVVFTNPARGSNVPMPLLAEAGKLLDLSKRPFVKRIPPKDKALFTVKGKVYGEPLFKTTSGINVNLTELKRRGWALPKTFNELLQLCGKAKAAGINLIALAGQSGEEVTNAVASATVYSIDPKWDTKRLAGKVRFAGSPLWTSAYNHMLAMKNADCFQPGWAAAGVPDLLQFMTTGRTLMQLAPSQGISNLASARPDLEWVSVPFPGDTPARTIGMIGYNFALSISATSPNKQLALAFIDFVGREGQSRLMATISGSISLHDLNVGNIPPRLSAYRTLIKSGKIAGRPSSIWPTPATVNLVSTVMGAVLTGTTSVHDALQQLDETWGK